MATHDYVVRRIKSFHENAGDDVTADLPGYQKPPRFEGLRGATYIPDIYVFDCKWVYEVKEYWAYCYAAPKLKAFIPDDEVEAVMLVLCSGTPGGVARVESFLEEQGVDCEVMNYRDLPFW